MLSATALSATMGGISPARPARHKANMFGSVALSTHSINGYTLIVGAEAIDVAEPLRGMQFFALSSPGASGATDGARIGTNHLISSPITPARNRES